ncbi:MAG: hypothetical protein ABI560_19440, partial [Myxococcales bacterium]
SRLAHKNFNAWGRSLLLWVGTFASAPVVAAVPALPPQPVRGVGVAPPDAQSPHAPSARSPAPLPETILVRDFLMPGAALIPTPRVLAAAGKRVRLIGFMAHMDLPSGGAFYLTPKPLVCDEAGGGTADLPPEAVRVTVPAARDRQIPFVAGPLEVTGMFDLGNQSEPDGRTSSFRN